MLKMSNFLNHKLDAYGEVPVDFVFDTGDDEVRWETTLLPDQCLLITLSSAGLSDLTKESFVALLELAEEQLQCREIFVEFPKQCPTADDRRRLIHAFFYFGFKPAAPNSTPFACQADHITMVYKVV